MPRKRPKSLETDVYRKLWTLENYAYKRALAWKKTYRYTLIEEFRQHITFAKNAYITGYEMLGRFKEEKARCFKAALEIRATINSYLGLLRHINGYKLRKEIYRQIESSALSKVFEAAPDYSKIIIRPQFSTEAYYKQQFKHLKKQLKTYYHEIR